MEAGVSGGQEAAQGSPCHLLPRELGGVSVLQLSESHILSVPVTVSPSFLYSLITPENLAGFYVLVS